MADMQSNCDPVSTRTRRRAVRLTEEGAAVLERTLLKRWEVLAKAGRLTRKARADLLGVSQTTSDRIMNHAGVDRNTLILAFRSMGLEWEDSYCTSMWAPDQTEPSTVTHLQTPPTRRWNWRIWTGAALVLAALLYVPVSMALDTWGYGRKQKSIHQQLVAEYYAGVREYQTGNFETAQEHCERVMALSQESRSYYDLAMALRLSGEIAAAGGDLQKAKRQFLDALSIRLTVQDVAALPATYEVLGDLEIRLREFDNAARHLNLSLDGYRKLNDKVGVAMALRNLGKLAFERGDLKRTSSFYAKALAEVADDPGSVDLVTDIWARQALVLREQGHQDEARSILLACLRHWQAKPHARWIGQTSLQIGTVERSAGRVEAARKWLEQARNAFQMVGDAAGVAECETELRILNRSARSSGSQAGPITPSLGGQ